MIRFLRWLDGKTYLMVLLFAFWAIFWGLNGLDKFFNGHRAANLQTWAAKGVLVDRTGQPAMTLHPIEPRGFFGVTRDKRMIGYFARIGMGKGMALFSLYALAVIEIILGSAFLMLFFWSMLPFGLRNRQSGLWGLFRDNTVQRLSFKGGIAVFVLFALGDILFGDRAELWEHGTYMLLCLVTYDMWYRTSEFITHHERKQAGKK